MLLFDLLNRMYRYPLEYIIEALAPTTELDFDRLPPEKQRIYRPDPGRAHARLARRPLVLHHRPQPGRDREFQLLGITDTAMLRPQVFALQEGEVSIGLICSEKQAIDATLASLAGEDPRFTPSPTSTGTPAAAATPTAARSSSTGQARRRDGGATTSLRVTNKFGETGHDPRRTRCTATCPSRSPADESE